MCRSLGASRIQARATVCQGEGATRHSAVGYSPELGPADGPAPVVALGPVEGAPVLVAVKVVRPVGRSTFTAPARPRGCWEPGPRGVFEVVVGPLASVLWVRAVADPKSR